MAYADVTPDALAQMYASDVISGFDIYKPEKLNVLFMRYGDQGASYFQLLRSLGFEKQVSLDTFGHYEDMRMHEVIINKSQAAAPGAGVDLTIQLHEDSIKGAAAASTNKYYPRVYDTVMFKNEVIGYIVSITWNDPEWDVVIRPNNVLDEIPQVEAAEEIIIISGQFAEGSGQPESALSGTWEYDNDCQIIKETYGVTGSEMTNQDWFNVTSMGMKIPAIYYKGQAEIDYRMALKIDGALLFGKRVTNTAAVDLISGRLLKATEGLVPYTRRIGHEHAYSAGSFDVVDFDDINLILDRENAGNYILSLLGIRLHTEIEDVLKAYFMDTNINFTTKVVNDVLFKKNESLGATVNFKYLTKSERTFLFKRMGNFSNPKTFGADYSATVKYDMPSMGLCIPLNRRKDPKNNNMVESIGCRYKGLGKYNRRMEVWNVGGAGEGLKVTEMDTRDTYLRAHIGAHHRGGNQFVLIDPS